MTNLKLQLLISDIVTCYDEVQRPLFVESFPPFSYVTFFNLATFGETEKYPV